MNVGNEATCPLTINGSKKIKFLNFENLNFGNFWKFLKSGQKWKHRTRKVVRYSKKVVLRGKFITNGDIKKKDGLGAQ